MRLGFARSERAPKWVEALAWSSGHALGKSKKGQEGGSRGGASRAEAAKARRSCKNTRDK